FFTFCAWLEGLSESERAVFASLELAPVGIGELPRLQGVALDRLSARIDDRLVFRYYRDPPEILTVLHGGSDGLHYGPSYDDPTSRPACAAHSQSNASPEIFVSGRTLVDAVLASSSGRESHLAGAPDQSEAERRDALGLAAWRRSIEEFQPPTDSGSAAPFHQGRIPTYDAMGVWVPGEYFERDCGAIAEAVTAASPERERWVEEALGACASGRPARALALGRDFHCLSRGEPARETIARRLLEAAYRALGRDALAEIAAIHH